MGREFSMIRPHYCIQFRAQLVKGGGGVTPSFPVRKNSIKIVGPKMLILALKAL